MKSTKSPSWIERLLGLEPQAPPPHVFWLDAAAIGYGAFRRADGALRFDGHYHRAGFPAGCFAEGPLGGVLREADAFQAALESCLADLPGGAPSSASLVLPDDWLRLAFTDVPELSAKRELRDEMLRFKLKRLVPFRVEDLRLAATAVAPLAADAARVGASGRGEGAGETSGVRVMIGFAIEQLLQQLEDAFTRAGVHIGRITNASLALSAALTPRFDEEDASLHGVIAVYAHAYTLTFVRAGEPVLYRYKALPGGDRISAGTATAVLRDLRLTRSYLDEQLGHSAANVMLAASPDIARAWSSWIADAFERPPQPVESSTLGLEPGDQPGLSWLEAGTLLGAARLEVA
ncbi:MAG: hypothetical protein AAF772_13775 [Acidobacteriota bacterium]